MKIEMSVAGEQIVLKSCSACDVRWWEDRGEHLPLADVLRDQQQQNGLVLELATLDDILTLSLHSR